jgi:hypothetical protein
MTKTTNIYEGKTGLGLTEKLSGVFNTLKKMPENMYSILEKKLPKVMGKAKNTLGDITRGMNNYVNDASMGSKLAVKSAYESMVKKTLLYAMTGILAITPSFMSCSGGSPGGNPAPAPIKEDLCLAKVDKIFYDKVGDAYFKDGEPFTIGCLNKNGTNLNSTYEKGNLKAEISYTSDGENYSAVVPLTWSPIGEGINQEDVNDKFQIFRKSMEIKGEDAETILRTKFFEPNKEVMCGDLDHDICCDKSAKCLNGDYISVEKKDGITISALFDVMRLFYSPDQCGSMGCE